MLLRMKHSTTGGTQIEKNGSDAVRVEGDSEVLYLQHTSLGGPKDGPFITLRRHDSSAKKKSGAVIKKEASAQQSHTGTNSVKGFFTGPDSKAKKRTIDDAAANDDGAVVKNEPVEVGAQKRAKREEAPSNAVGSSGRLSGGEKGDGDESGGVEMNYHVWNLDSEPTWILLRWCYSESQGKKVYRLHK